MILSRFVEPGKRRRASETNRVGSSGKIKKTRKIGKSGAFNVASALAIFNFAFILNFCEENKTARTVAAIVSVAREKGIETSGFGVNRLFDGRVASEIVESNGRAGKKFFALDNFTLKKVDFKRFFGYYIKDGVLFRRVDALRAARRDRFRAAGRSKNEKTTSARSCGASATGSKAKE